MARALNSKQEQCVLRDDVHMTLITQRTVDKERTESELRSCEATKAVAKDAQKNT